MSATPRTRLETAINCVVFLLFILYIVSHLLLFPFRFLVQFFFRPVIRKRIYHLLPLVSLILLVIVTEGIVANSIPVNNNGQPQGGGILTAIAMGYILISLFYAVLPSFIALVALIVSTIINVSFYRKGLLDRKEYVSNGETRDIFLGWLYYSEVDGRSPLLSTLYMLKVRFANAWLIIVQFGRMIRWVLTKLFAIKPIVSAICAGILTSIDLIITRYAGWTPTASLDYWLLLMICFIFGAFFGAWLHRYVPKGYEFKWIEFKEHLPITASV